MSRRPFAVIYSACRITTVGLSDSSAASFPSLYSYYESRPRLHFICSQHAGRYQSRWKSVRILHPFAAFYIVRLLRLISVYFSVSLLLISCSKVMLSAGRKHILPSMGFSIYSTSTSSTMLHANLTDV
jgi:hypothetical protein